MSKAHELTLFDKWSESVLPPLSPTSPKATKFCCCPNRRRYNIKQPKAKSTLDARNIFLGTNEFTYNIVDADLPSNISGESSTRNVARKGYKAYDNYEKAQRQEIAAFRISNHNDENDELKAENNSDYENYDEDANGLQPLNCEGTEQKCDKEKQSEHSNNQQANNSIVTKIIKSTCDNENAATISLQQATTATTTTATIKRQQENDSSCLSNFRSEQQQQQQTIQRLSNSETNNCNNHKELQSTHHQNSNDNCCCHCLFELNDNKPQEQQPQQPARKFSTGLLSTPDNYCQRQQPHRRASVGTPTSVTTAKPNQDVVDSACFVKQCKIDLPKTMTITTTTNVAANRKNNNNDDDGDGDGKCGLTIKTPAKSSSSSSSSTMTESQMIMPASPTAMTIVTAMTTTATTTTPPPPRPLTPSLTTVIKTTMVKRSPANESKSAPTTPTTAPPTFPAMNADFYSNEKSIASQATSNGFTQSSEHSPKLASANKSTNDRLSVKERIAALVAGNEQIKHHDNSIRTRTQCNKNQSNMTIATKTPNVQSAINSLQQHHKRQSVISADRNDSQSSNCSSFKCNTSNAATVITTPSTESSSSSPTTSSSPSSSTVERSSAAQARAQVETLISINDIPPRHKSGLNDAQRVSFALPTNTLSTSSNAAMSDAAVQAALLAGNTGCATLPRRRSPMCERSILKHGSNTGANIMETTAKTKTTLSDKKNSTTPLSASSSLPMHTAESPTKTTTSRKLADLDNLDLALNMDLNDDDGEDPYYALEEYLERVKHEINEVFELHKARQRMHQQQEQLEQEANLAPKSAKATTASNDELSRSTESDSGFDSASASGGHYRSSTSNSTSNSATASSKNNMTGSSNKQNNSSQLQISATATNNDNDDGNDDGGDGVHAAEISCGCPIDINGHASLVKSTSNAAKSALAEIESKQKQTQIENRKTTATTANNNNGNSNSNSSPIVEEQQTNRRFTKLKALSPPTPQMQTQPPATATTSTGSSEDVNIWANKFLQDLDNLMATNNGDKPTYGISSSSVSSSPTSASTTTASPMLLSAAAKAAIQCRYGNVAPTAFTDAHHRHHHEHQREQPASVGGIVLVRPEKHSTIPLQSFNLDCGGRVGDVGGSGGGGGGGNGATKTNIPFMRTLSAPTPYQQHQYQLQQQQQQQQQQQNNHKLVGIASGKNNQRNSLATLNATIDTLQQQTMMHHPHAQNLTNFQGKKAATADHSSNSSSGSSPTLETTTLLKIEETTTSGRTCANNDEMTTIAPHDAAVNTAEDINNIIGQDDESLKRRRQRQLENDMETIRNSLAVIESLGINSSSDKSMAVATTATNMATSIPKRERINHATTTTTTLTTTNGNSLTTTSKPTPATALTSSPAASSPSSSSSSTKAASTSGYLLMNGSEATKKGSTSTIWTSEESILRSVGAVDEDNNSTSSSACEEASGVLSSGKSGVSLDSSGLDNDNNESGIGTATPPKDLAYWKSIRHNDNESLSSLDAVRKMKFQKSSSVASSDDPDLLEVLSLCDEEPRNGDEDVIDESHDGIDERQKRISKQQQIKQKLISSTPNQNQRRIGHQQHHHNHNQHHNYLSQRGRQQENKNNDSLSGQATVEAIEATEDSIMLDETTKTSTTASTNTTIASTTNSTLHANDEDDEGHDEFEMVPYCDCDCTDGDVSSASGGSAPNGSPIALHNDSGTVGGGVVLRRKCAATPIMVPYNGNGAGRRQKNRSHSLDTSSLPTSVYHTQSPHHLPPHAAGYHHQLHHQLHHHHHHQHVGQSQLSRKLHHLQNRNKERGKLSLALRQEPFQSLLAPAHFHELPSPSSASLHSGHECIGIQELTTKSNSAPLLLKQEKQKRDDFVGQKLSLRYSRSQSDRYLAEIEAVEACKWLRAAGFPQYAQMYEDHQFPIDITNVAKDHTNLENDQLQSLYRRLATLNRCATMRLDQSHKPQTPQKEDSDDENFALSENWTFQPHIRRWSRIGEQGLELPPVAKLNAEKTESSSKESSPDRFEDDDNYDISGAMLSLTLPSGATCESADAQDAGDEAAVRLRRTGSERLKDGAKALLRRVESIKSRRRKRQNRDGVVISGPQALDLSQLGQRSSLRKPDAVYSTPPSPSAVSPMHTFPTMPQKSPFYGNELKVPSQSEHFLSPNRASPKRTPTTPRSMRTSPLHFFSNAMPHLREGKSDDSSSYYSDSQESSAGGKVTMRKTPSKTRRFLQRTGKVDDIGAHSDSECHHGRKLLIKDANSNTTEVKIKKLTRGGSLNLGRDSKKRDGFRSASFRSRSTSRKETKADDADSLKKSPVVRWHSFQMEERPHMVFRKCFSQKIDPQQEEHGTSFAAMSAGQLQIIRKLALVILTGHMERYCPTHRSGWNWELPKFIKKMKLPPDYKDKKVFGVPLLLVLQRTGQTLPTAVRAAFRWLQLNALDQIGLFRKSGVKSRILRLKELIEFSETTTECMDVFDNQQAYDVADMLKQYFRDLPESLLTTKMSETFVAIFQHLPPEVRLDAIQCAVLLLPDENREILYALLEFLTIVAGNAKYNQMTANNLAVCLAPSLFHNNIATGAGSVSASPRRRNKGGMPDNKELSEAKASHECLAFMIDNYKQIFTASKDKIHKCNFGYMEESKPVPLEALGEGMQFHNWRGYLYECTSATIKEGREKTRGWFTVTTQTDPNVEVAYKKVGDGHPLRLWRCITDVEGPPKEVLAYIIKQRASWDPNLLQCQTVKKLDERTEIYQYAIDGQVTTDFCVLRSWQTDLPRGACVIVETSIDHGKAKPLFGAVRGVVLASRYLIEPCGGGKSRVMHLARVDIKGRTPEWYNKCFGHLCSHYLARIRADFKNIADGPESKV